MKIIFDYNRTLFDPEIDTLYDGVADLLRFLHGKHELFLVSRNEPGRGDRLKDFGIESYFHKTAFVEEKTRQVFLDLISDAKDVIVIGDRAVEEIAIGNEMRFVTVWLRQGKFSREVPTEAQQPTHIIRDIRELENIISFYE